MREAEEEAGVVLDEHALAPFAIWTTPENMPKRFVTWFFAASVDAIDVRVDGGEIHEHRWMRASAARAARRAGEIELPPPTFVTLHQLEPHQDADAAVQALAERGLQRDERPEGEGPTTSHVDDRLGLALRARALLNEA